jgi:hypothetical protein
VKLRVSGPEARRAEVEGAMNALLRELRFEGQPGPAAVTPIMAPNCRQTPRQPARLIRSTDADAAEDAIMAHNLAGGGTDRGLRDEPDASPNRQGWCRSAGYSIPDAFGATPVLRDESPPAQEGMRRSVLVAIWGDNGVMLEVVEQRSRERSRFVAIHHQIGQTTILGAFDSIPTDAQLRAIATGEDREGSRPRATINYQASGDSSVTVNVAREPAAPRT